MRSLTNRLLPYRLLFATLLLLLSVAIAVGQDAAARPDRGVMPGGSYSVSDIENISLQNGNLNLEIPLAALPPIAGGKLSWVIKARYNSKLWNITRAQADAPDNEYHPYVIDTPQLSDLGGWRVTGQYIISIRRAEDDFAYLTEIPPDSLPYNEYQLLINYNWYKVVLSMPDGSEHEMRPIDYQPIADGTGLTFLYGYYRESPYATGTMRYYSFDGSYIYATVTADNNWTVVLPDGTKVVQTTDGIQRVQDTNGNKIKIFSDAGGTHYQDEQTGREIRYFYNPAGNGGLGQGQVWYQTVGGTWMHIDINFGFTTVEGQVYKVKDWIPFALNECNRHAEINTQVDVIREIILPQSEPGVTRKFSFSYNSDTTETATNPWVRFTCSDPLQSYTRTASKGWGALSQMVTPSGAVVDYSYVLDSVHLPIFNDDIAGESLNKKKLNHDGTFDEWTYNVNATTGITIVTNPDNSTVTESHFTHHPGFAFSFGKAGLSYRSVRPFTRIDRHWTDKTFSGASINSPGGPVSFNPVVDVEYTTLLDAGGNFLKMSAKAFQYDYNRNVSQTTEYDWFDPALVSRDSNGVPTGVPASATALRVVNNTYYNPATSSSSGNVYAKRFLSTLTPLIVNAVQQTTLGPAITQFSYDGQAYGTAPTVGNLTSQKVWDDLDNKWITSSQTYGLYGNLVTKTDPRGKVTQFYFDDATHALPNRVVVDPQNGTGTQTVTTAFDYYTGLVTSQTDANLKVSSVDYTNQLLGTVDPFGRAGVTIDPLVNAGGVNQHHRTTTTYLDNARQVIVAADLNSENDKLLKTRTTSDMLGRVILSEQSEDGSTYAISARKIYEQMGKITYSSNPARSAGASTDGWTRTTADALGRIIEVATFGGTAQPPSNGSGGIFTGNVTTSYDANFTSVTDQNGKLRRSMVDGSGRLVRVDEPDGNNNLGTTVSPIQPTSYTYDVFGNLRTVVQGSQTRSFTYDSLSRLRSAINPESGTVNYTYDDNGNLLTKTDARGVTSTYSYDALNRNITIDYSNTTIGSPNVPDITRVYDGATNGKSRLWESYAGGTASVGSTVEHTKVTGYDAVGRPLSQLQEFKTNGVWGPTYTTQRGYNIAGEVTSQINPSGRTVAYSYDTAGRASSFSGNLGDGTQRNYSTEIIYSPLGGMTKEKFGTDTALYNKLFYNSRGQLAEIREGTSYAGPTDTGWERGAIINYYSTCWGMCYDLASNTSQSMPDNNGNLKKQEIFVPGASSWLQQYDYDNLNRLQGVSESTGGTTLWRQEYVYDRYGNRTIHQTNTWGSGIPKPNFGVATASNRLTPPTGYTMSYDAAGNLSNDTYTGAGTRTYDAENRMTTAWGGNNQSQVYNYNADGQRTRRKVDGVETWQIYGMDGELVAEYAANGLATSPQKEYGYRNGQLLVTAEATLPEQNVIWTSVTSTLQVTGNSLQKTSGTSSWYDAGAISTQSITSGDGYVEFTPGNTTTWRMIGLGNGNTGIHYSDIEYALFVGPSAGLQIYEAGILRGSFGTYAGADRLRVAVEGGVVKYRKNGALVYTSTVAPTYPLLVDTSFNTVNSAVYNVVLAASSGGGIKWLVTDQLGTPRMVFDKTGALANVKRHDYLPFGEELFNGARTTALGYGVADGVRQKFTQKERDNETGLDFFEARYYASTQGRFTSPDPIFFQKEMLLDPQRFNLYGYVRNNPLKLVDPKGLAIELTGDEVERKRRLAAAQQAVGPEAGAYLYENKGKDGKYYIGIYTNGPDGKGKPFEQINSVAGDFSKVINDSFVAKIELVPQGTAVTVEGGQTTIGKLDAINRTGPGASYVEKDGRATIWLLDPANDPGRFPALLMSDQQALQLVLSDVLAHEIGHVEARWGHVFGSPNTNAVDLENRARKLRDPNAPMRTGHDKPGDAVGPQPFIINVRPGTERGWKP
jgi:RHS repeat-associated protein